MRLFLCGFSGAGKTTVAAKVASRLNATWIDTDQVLAAGEDLAARIERIGWEQFRREENELLMRLSGGLKGDDLVISLGGGALNDAVLPALNEGKNRLIFINTPFSVCWERIKADPARPLALMGEAKMKELFEKRLPLYKQAQLELSAEEAVDELVKYVASFNRG